MAVVFESKTTDLCYIPILKNASTWGRHIFVDNLGFEEKHFVLDPVKKYIIFLRNPIDRWVSGVMEYIQILQSEPLIEPYLQSNCRLDPLHLALMCTIIRFDAHTVRQADYIKECYPGLPQENIIYFDVSDKDFAFNVTGFLGRMFRINLPTDKINNRVNNLFKQHLEKQIMDFLDGNPKFRQKIELYFERDRIYLKNVNLQQWASGEVGESQQTVNLSPIG